jgi:hypothetical protein
MPFNDNSNDDHDSASYNYLTENNGRQTLDDVPEIEEEKNENADLFDPGQSLSIDQFKEAYLKEAATDPADRYKMTRTAGGRLGTNVSILRPLIKQIADELKDPNRECVEETSNQLQYDYENKNNTKDDEKDLFIS